VTHSLTLGFRTATSRSKIPAPRELKRPNGHKVQLALRREIKELSEHIERERKALSAAQRRIHDLENQLLTIIADRDGWRTRAEAHGRFVAQLEELLGLSADGRSWEERREQLFATIGLLLEKSRADRRT